jgi:hypothetical protein
MAARDSSARYAWVSIAVSTFAKNIQGLPLDSNITWRTLLFYQT